MSASTVPSLVTKETLPGIHQLQEEGVQAADRKEFPQAIRAFRQAHRQVMEMIALRDKHPNIKQALEGVRDFLHECIRSVEKEMELEKQRQEMSLLTASLKERRVEEVGGGTHGSSSSSLYTPSPGISPLGSGLSEQDRNIIERIESRVIIRESPEAKGADRVLLSHILGAEQAKYALAHELDLFSTPEEIALRRHVTRETLVNGLLFYGPAGTGKTMLAKALWGETLQQNKNATFYSIECGSIFDKYVGESERMLIHIFAHARRQEKAILLFDEVNNILADREQGGQTEVAQNVKNTFLLETAGVGRNNANIIPISATNFPWQIDDASARRLGKFIYVGLPTYEERVVILQHHLQTLDHVQMSLEDIQRVAKNLERYSQSDIRSAFHILGQKRMEFLIKEGRWVHVRPPTETRSHSLYVYLREEEKEALASQDPQASIQEIKYAQLIEQMNKKMIHPDHVWPPLLGYEELLHAFRGYIPKNKAESVEKMKQWIETNKTAFGL